MPSAFKVGLAQMILDELRKIDPEMPIQVAQVFLVVAAAGATTMAEIVQRAGISQSSVSRNVAALAKINRFHKPGHDLIEAVEDPVERRRKIVRLTTRGIEVARGIEKIVSPRSPPTASPDPGDRFAGAV